MDQKLDHLIIVCCHGVWLGGTPAEENWLIQPFQAGETPTFISHIKSGLRLLVQDAPGQAALMFSGAPTREETHVSEADSYLSLAQSQSFWDIIPFSAPQPSANRYGPITPRSEYTPFIIAEVRALDSFQNVLFSLAALSAVYGHPPKKVTVISHEFKRARFEELHFPVLKEMRDTPNKPWAYRDVEVVFEGQDPPYMVEGNQQYDAEKAGKVREAERKNGIAMWEKDPKGEGKEVLEKRRKRDVSGVQFARRPEERVTEVE